VLVSVFYWFLICMLMRYSLKGLLIYKGWMREARGSGSKTSLSTKIWFVLVKGNTQRKAHTEIMLISNCRLYFCFFINTNRIT
jgi:hypothetical protein